PAGRRIPARGARAARAGHRVRELLFQSESGGAGLAAYHLARVRRAQIRIAAGSAHSGLEIEDALTADFIDLAGGKPAAGAAGHAARRAAAQLRGLNPGRAAAG